MPCDRGYYLPQRNLTSCLPCPKGQYQDEQGQVKCKSCLAGSTTKDVGSDHPTMCSVRVLPGAGGGSSGGNDVTEDNAEAILDDPTLGL